MNRTKQLRGHVPSISEAQVKTASSGLPSMHHNAIESPAIESIARPYKPKFHKAAFYHSNHTGSQSDQYEPSASTSGGKRKASVLATEHRDNNIENGFSLTQHQQQVNIEPYRFRILRSLNSKVTNANFTEFQLAAHKLEYLEQHISKIISQNEAIVEGVEPALQKKYHKITGIPRGLAINSSANDAAAAGPSLANQSASVSDTTDDAIMGRSSNHTDHTVHDLTNSRTKAIPTLQQQAKKVLRRTIPLPEPAVDQTAQPLNLSAESRATTFGGYVPADAQPPSTSTFYENHHPQNPERSIIKSLLLNSRGLAVPTTGEGADAIFMCPLCKTTFRSADDLQCHTKSYCQGTPQTSVQNSNQLNGSPHSAPISPVGSPSHKYHRSNSFNMYLPEKYSPNTLAKLASSTLRHHLTPLTFARLAAYHAAGYHPPKGPTMLPQYASHSLGGKSEI